jgi:hypothetical protein
LEEIGNMAIIHDLKRYQLPSMIYLEGILIFSSSHQIFQKIYNSNTKDKEILTLLKNLMGTSNI